MIYLIQSTFFIRMELTYQQVLAEQYDENSKNLLVQQMDDYDYAEIADYNAELYDENDLPEKDEFNKFHGDRNKPEHVIKPKADPDALHRQKVRVRNQIVNIDSKFRGNIVPTNTAVPTNPADTIITCSGTLPETSLITGTSSSYFIYYPDRPYKNVKSVKITSLEFPNTFYTFSAARGNTQFTTNITGLYGDRTWTLPDGNYTIQEVVSTFNTLITAGSGNFQLKYNSNTNKVSFTSTNSNFSLRFKLQTTGPYGNGIGYNLGFLQTYYNSTSPTYSWDGTNASYTAETVPDVVQDPYVYVVMNDYNLLNHPVYGQTTIQAFGKITLQTGKNTIVYDNNYTNSTSKIYHFPQPTNVTKFEIKFIDSYGNVLDLNGAHVSITLELEEVLDSGIYENMLQM